MMADQQRRMAGAIDEQVASDIAVLARRDRCDATLIIARHVDDMIR